MLPEDTVWLGPRIGVVALASLWYVGLLSVRTCNSERMARNITTGEALQ